MPLKLADVEYENLLSKNHEKALSLKNRFSFINANILPILSKDEQDLLLEFQKVAKKIFKTYNIEDTYESFPKLGEYNMIQRMNPWKGIDGSIKQELLLSLAVYGIAPELDMALWQGLFVHKDTPADVREKIIAVAAETMKSDTVLELSEKTGVQVYWMDAEAAKAQILKDSKTMGVINKAME